MKKILIYGVGNPYKCDDAVGIKVADILKTKVNRPNITIKSGSIAGLAMLDEIIGFDKAIFIDAIKTENGKAGEIYKIELNPLENSPSLSVSHGINFITALRTGKKLGYNMPKSISIYGVEIKDNTSFSEECTEDVQASVPEVVEKIIADLKD